MRSLIQAILSSLYAIYTFAFLILLDPRPQTESREQFSYFLSISLLLLGAWFLTRCLYRFTQVETRYQEHLFHLLFFLSFSVWVAKAEAYSWTSFGLSLGLLFSGLAFFVSRIPPRLLKILVLLSIAGILLLIRPLSLPLLFISFLLAILGVYAIWKPQSSWGLWACLGGIILFAFVPIPSSSAMISWIFLIATVLSLVYAIAMAGFIEKLHTISFKIQSLPKRWIADSVAILMIIIASFDLSLLYDSHHYNFYLANLNDILRGKTMLVDSFSMYGISMPYFLVLPFWAGLLPLTGHGLSFVISLLTCLEMLLVYGILRSLTQSITWSALGVLLIIIFHLYVTATNYLHAAMLPLPSVGVLRFGWIYCLFALSAWRYRHPHQSRFLRTCEWLVLAIIATWSLEAIVFVFPAHFAMRVYENLQASSGAWRNLMLPILREMGLLLFILFLAWGGFALFIWFMSGNLPEFQIYLAYILRFNNQIYELSPGFRIQFWSLWPLIVFVYLFYLVFIAHLYQDKVFSLPFPLVGLLLSAVLSFYYWVGNSTILSSMVISPLLLLVYGLWRVQKEQSIRKTFNTAIISSLLIILFYSILQINTAMYSLPGFLFAQSQGAPIPALLPLEANAIIERDIFRDGGLPIPDPIAEDAIALAEEYISEEESIFIFLENDSSITALLHLQRSQFFPMSNEFQDSLNPLALERMLGYIPLLEAGQRFITMRDWEDIGLDTPYHSVSASRLIIENICEVFGISELAALDSGVVAVELVPPSPETTCENYWQMD